MAVSTHRKNGMIRVTVSDQGPGIPADFHEKIFNKFTQVDGSNTRTVSGTGLGLSITKAIVERLGGHLGFVSTEGQGTDFFVDVPVAGTQS